MILAGLSLLLLSSPGNGSEVHLKNGDRLGPVGVFDNLMLRSWSVDGVTAPYRAVGIFAEFVQDKKLTPKPNPDNTLAIVFRIIRPKASDAPSVAFKRPGQVARSAAWTYLGDEGMGNPQIWTAGLSRPFKDASINLMVGVSESKWRTDSMYSYNHGKLRYRAGVNISANILSYKKGDLIPVVPGSKVKHKAKQEGCVVTAKLPLTTERAYQIVALDRGGKPLSGGGTMTPTTSRMPTYFWFSGKPSTLSRIEFQTRPYEWTSFRDIHLKPN
jgi:hypothetical protein